VLRERGEKTARPWEPERYRQDVQSPAAKRPEGDVVFFRLATGPQLARSRFSAPDEHDMRGAPPSDPARMVCLWLSASWGGGFARRKLALACARHLAFLALGGQDRPAFRTSSAVRTPPLEACKDVVVQVVRLAAAAGLVRLGHGATEGPNIQGHAARPKARRAGERQQAVERRRAAIEALGTQAAQQDAADEAAVGRRRGDARPAALARRADRLARIEAARRRWAVQARAAAAAAAERPQTGKPRRGKAPTPVEDRPDAKAQSTGTAPALQSMRTHPKGWDSGGQAQARVDGACQLIGACEGTAAAHDQQQAEPLAQATRATLSQAGLERPQEAAGAIPAIPVTVEKGDYSAAAVVALAP
jgi:hypothetical protein